MNRRGFFLVIVIGVVMFALGMFVDSFRSTQQTATIESPVGFPLQIMNVRESEPRLYDISATYPHFDSLPDSFNDSIKGFVVSQIMDFKKAARENMEARIATLPEEERNTFIPEPFYFSASWSPSQVNDSYVSFIIRTYSYEGGANGREELATWNYDVRNRREVGLRELFPEEGDNYIEKISKSSREALVRELGFDIEGAVAFDILEAGTEPKEENFRHFTFTDEVVTVYFEKYQVAPGSFGEQRAMIPRVIVR